MLSIKPHWFWAPDCKREDFLSRWIKKAKTAESIGTWTWTYQDFFDNIIGGKNGKNGIGISSYFSQSKEEGYKKKPGHLLVLMESFISRGLDPAHRFSMEDATDIVIPKPESWSWPPWFHRLLTAMPTTWPTRCRYSEDPWACRHFPCPSPLQSWEVWDWSMKFIQHDGWLINDVQFKSFFISQLYVE